MDKRAFLRRALVSGITAGVLAAALPLAVNAQGPSNLYGRVQRQQQRLQAGVQNGQLTQREYNRDEARIDAINQQRSADLKANGGNLTAAERQTLNGELNRSSRGIGFTKHNAAAQPGARDFSKKPLPKLPPPNSPNYVADRVQRQLDRIHNGVVTGALTQPEYQRDRAQLAEINQQREAWLKRQGGTLTSAQQAQLNTELDAESSRIWYTRHNLPDQPGR
jgi:hypothetical protein